MIVKIDQNLGSKNQFSGRYFFGNSNQSFPLGLAGGNNLPNTNTNAPIRTQLVSISNVTEVSTRIKLTRRASDGTATATDFSRRCQRLWQSRRIACT